MRVHVAERVQPDQEPVLDVREQLAGHERPEHEQQEPDDQPGRALGGDVHHHHEQAEEQRGGADVALEDQDHQADAPGDQHRAQVAGPGQVDAEHPPPGQRQHVPLGHQVAREEHGQAQLGEFLGLHGEAAQGYLDLGEGAGHLADAVRQHRGQGQQHQADGAQRVGVPLQRARLPDEGEHGHEGHDAHRAVEDLESGGLRAHRGDREAGVAAAAGLLQPVDHHDAEPVQQRGQRQQQRVGPRGQPAHRHVRRADQHGEGQAVHEHAGRHLAVQPQPHVGVGEHHHADHEGQHEQLGPAPALRHGHAGRLAILRGGVPAAAQRLVGRAGDRAHDYPPVPAAVLAGGGGQSAGMVGFGGLTFSVTVFFPTLSFTVLAGVACHVRSAA